MKYIKKYEEIDDGMKFYWLLPTDEKFENSLQKIGCKEPYLSNFLGIHKWEYENGTKYIFIGVNLNEPEIDKSKYKGMSDRWGWNPYRDETKTSITNEWYEKNNYKFNGLVDIEPYEFSMKKYNL